MSAAIVPDAAVDLVCHGQKSCTHLFTLWRLLVFVFPVNGTRCSIFSSLHTRIKHLLYSTDHAFPLKLRCKKKKANKREKAVVNFSLSTSALFAVPVATTTR